jgi:hypothetical protein
MAVQIGHPLDPLYPRFPDMARFLGDFRRFQAIWGEYRRFSADFVEASIHTNQGVTRIMPVI